MSSPITRRQLITQRQESSFFWKVVHLLGSLKLALLLLATIAIACALATFAESHFDTKVAHTYIYKAPWFLVWLGVLSLNLFAVTLTRWPWEKKHLGFVITHYGIITLLMGAAIGSKFGFEGDVTLHIQGAAVQKITTNQSVLQVESPRDHSLYLLPFDISVVKPSEKKPTVLAVPGTTLRMVINGNSEDLERVPYLIPTSDQDAKAVIIKLCNASSHQEEYVALGSGAQGKFDFFGLAEIYFNQERTRSFIARAASSPNTPWLAIDLTPEKKEIHYQLGRGSTVKTTGALVAGDWLQLGWGEWKLQLVDVGAERRVGFHVEPASSGMKVLSASDQQSLPGFHAFLKNQAGHVGPACWVESGEITSLTLDDDVVRVAYGLELKPIPFSIELIDFQVPRDEGTEAPSDFKATVRFHDLKKNVTRDDLLRMNHPASFPGGFFANATGINYKFSQAQWNPRDIGETTLQVLYDPGWLLKWIGSLGICIGIAMMFYWKP